MRLTLILVIMIIVMAVVTAVMIVLKTAQTREIMTKRNLTRLYVKGEGIPDRTSLL